MNGKGNSPQYVYGEYCATFLIFHIVEDYSLMMWLSCTTLRHWAVSR